MATAAARQQGVRYGRRAASELRDEHECFVGGRIPLRGSWWDSTEICVRRGIRTLVLNIRACHGAHASMMQDQDPACVGLRAPGIRVHFRPCERRSRDRQGRRYGRRRTPNAGKSVPASGRTSDSAVIARGRGRPGLGVSSQVYGAQRMPEFRACPRKGEHVSLGAVGRQFDPDRAQAYFGAVGGVLPMVLNRADPQVPLEYPGTPELPSVAARRMWVDTVAHDHAPAPRTAWYSAPTSIPGQSRVPIGDRLHQPGRERRAGDHHPGHQRGRDLRPPT